MRNNASPLAAAILCALLALTSPAWGDPSVQMAKSLPPPDATATVLDKQLEYRIGPLDSLEITVFQVQYLDHPIQVGADGHIGLPLIGDMAAAGKTPRELADEIAAKLGERYLQSPQVTVSVKDAISQKFTVEGSVAKPGMYDAVGSTTLLQALALAEGADQYANVHNVAVFRMVDKRRAGAVYDLAAIRSGKADDPQIYGGDIVVVGASAVRRFLRDVAPGSPFISLFRPF
jgi:polysaccharide export outer membrane protein